MSPTQIYGLRRKNRIDYGKLHKGVAPLPAKLVQQSPVTGSWASNCPQQTAFPNKNEIPNTDAYIHCKENEEKCYRSVDKQEKKNKARSDKDKYKHKANGRTKKESDDGYSEKEKQIDKYKIKQAEKDNDTLAIIEPLTITKLGRIPKKCASSTVIPAEEEKEVSRNNAFSIDVVREERPKTVKIFHSKMRSAGLEKATKSIPARPIKKLTTSLRLPTISMKRSLSTRYIRDHIVPPKKKLRMEQIVLHKPKPALLQGSKRVNVDGELKGILLYNKKKGPKRSISWNDKDLVEIRYFELDETERVNVMKTFGDMTKMDISSEREVLQQHKVGGDGSMEAQIMWRIPFFIDQDDALVIPGNTSLEKHIQFARRNSVLQDLYFDKRRIPDSPEEPVPENQQMSNPIRIPLEDPESLEMDMRSRSWPEAKGFVPLPEPVVPTMFPNIQGPFNVTPSAFLGFPPRFDGLGGQMRPVVLNNFFAQNVKPSANMMGPDPNHPNPPNKLPPSDMMVQKNPMDPNMFPTIPINDGFNHDHPQSPISTTRTTPITLPLNLTNNAPLNSYQDTLTETKEENKDTADNVENDTAEEKVPSDLDATEKAEPSGGLPPRTPTDEKQKECEVERGEELREVLYTKNKSQKRSISWKNDSDLVEIRYFEVDETERVNVTKTFGDMSKMDISSEREVLQQYRKVGGDDSMGAQIMWRIPFFVDQDDALVIPGNKSLEKDIQFAREKSVLPVLYFDKREIPDSSEEPVLENHQMSDPIHIPLEDLEMDIRSTPWFAGPDGPMGPVVPNKFFAQSVMPSANLMRPGPNHPNMLPPPSDMIEKPMNPNMFLTGSINVRFGQGKGSPMFGHPTGTPNKFSPNNNFIKNPRPNNRGGGGGFRKGSGNNEDNWMRMSGGAKNWKRGGGHRVRRLCKNVQNYGYCRNRHACLFVHP